MSSWGSCDFHELEEFKKKLANIDKDKDKFYEDCAKELAARLLAKAIKRTPVGDYSKEVTVTAKRDGKTHKKGEQYTKKVNVGGKTGGTLRRGWTTQANGSGSEGLRTSGAKQFTDTMKVHSYGGYYVIEITNPVEYASYVEYGHRTRDHKGWVQGKFMMTISEKEVNNIAPSILQKKLEEFLKEVFNA